MVQYFKNTVGTNDTKAINILNTNSKAYSIMYHVVSEGSGDRVDGTTVKTQTKELYTLMAGDVKTCFDYHEEYWYLTKAIGKLILTELKKG